MNANDLKHRVELWKYDRTVNAGGTPIEQFLFYKYTYAAIKLSQGASEGQYENAGMLPITNIDITIRFDEGVNYNTQIKYKLNTYTITYIEETTEKFLKMRCMLYNEDKN